MENSNTTSINVFSGLILCLMVFTVPIIILPGILDNVFELPKDIVMITGALLLSLIYSTRYLSGRETQYPRSQVGILVPVLILLNLFSFIYTRNPYFTLQAAALNISCLMILYYLTIYNGRSLAIALIILTAISGVLVSIITYLQYASTFILLPWAHPGIMVMGTIGNSNYLGAYLIFPLLAWAGLFFMWNGKKRAIPLFLFTFVFGALLLTRARASWLGVLVALPVFILLIRRIYGTEGINRYFKSHPIKVLTLIASLSCLVVILWHSTPEQFHRQMEFSNITNSTTLRLRIEKYCKSSLHLFSQSPLIGTGLWSYRNSVYESQARIQIKDPSYFRNFPEPKPRRVHMDYLEILNDGGILAGLVLLTLFLIIMRHGWRIISNQYLRPVDRVMAAIALSSLVGIMLAAVFFFPFRVNSTLFCTTVMMGLIEGIYLRNFGIPKTIKLPWWRGLRGVLLVVVFISAIGVSWYLCVKPLYSEMEYLKYKKAMNVGNPQAAREHITKALMWDPRNTQYNLNACQLYSNILGDQAIALDYAIKVIEHYNGDIIAWSMHYIRGLIYYQTGALFLAMADFNKALYYYPAFDPARQKRDEVVQTINRNDRILRKFR